VKASVKLASRLALRPAFSLMLRRQGRWRIEGASQVPRSGPLIILANHRSTLDPPFLNFTIPRHVTFMAWSGLWENPRLAPFIRWYGAIPVELNSPDRAALRAAETVLSRGGALGIFPEGWTRRGEGLGELQPGFTLLARRTGAPVAPCGLVHTDVWQPDGADRIVKGPHPPLIARWGAPRTFGKDDRPDVMMAWAAEEIVRLSRAP
jgi:1-acyl-sn-glycerol-3-phosphate acyltransferase